MNALKYSKTFKKRNEDLNEPSKEYYLKKDEVNDVHSKLVKKYWNQLHIDQKKRDTLSFFLWPKIS